jgi:SagB-type dehydrogenase family enzyme
MTGHVLDWAQQPAPVKRYLHRQPLDLPAPRPPRAGFWELALAWPPPPDQRQAPPDAADLAAMLLLAGGINATTGGLGLRSAASAGALYPVELYAAATGLEGLDDGLYHFLPEGPALHRLREGPLAAAAARSAGGEPAALWFFLSVIFWRSVWKYRARAYRYCLLDAGHVLANLELAAAACGVAPRPAVDFADASAGALLALAGEEEGPVAALAAGPAPAEPGPEQAGLPPFDLQSQPLSQRVGREPAVLAAHAAGFLDRPAAPPAWQSHRPPAGSLRLDAPAPQEVELLSVVRSRRSRRNFLARPLEEESLAALLAAALPAPGPCQAQALVAPGGPVEGGVYRYLSGPGLLAPVGPGEDRRGGAARACLGQAWVGQAALVLVLWADVAGLEELHGPRAYRHAMLAAGRAGQRLYLAATALGLGACGVGAYYDRELAAAAMLPEAGWPLYLVAAGPVKGFSGPR